MFVRDLNGDGLDDFVLLQRGSGEVRVLLGDREHLLRPPRSHDLGAPLASAASADLDGGGRATAAFADVDGDGHVDLIALDDVMRHYHVLRGLPDGSFEKLASGPTPEGAMRVLAADFTGDGRADLAFPGPNILARGDGQGHFAGGPTLAKGLRLRSADADGDGVNELLTLDIGEPVDWMTPVRVQSVQVGADGTPAFRPLATFEMSVDAFGPHLHGDLRMADVNGDGRRDLVFPTGGEDRSLLFCLQGTDGSCSLLRTSGFNFMQDVDVADLDGDALPEYVTVEQGYNGPSYAEVHRVRDGQWPDTTLTLLRLVDTVTGVVALDLDRDGRKELVLGSHNLRVIRPEGPSFRDPHFDVGGAVRELAGGDFTGDGRKDIAARNEHGQLFLLTGREDGTLTPPRELSVSEEARGWTGMRAGDLDGDEREELLLFGKDAAVTLLSASDEGFTESRPFAQPAFSAEVADLNRDGRLDVVLGHAGGAVSYLARADGAFSPWAVSPHTLESFLLRDVSGDGVPDMLYFSNVLLRGLGDGRFEQVPGVLEGLVYDHGGDHMQPMGAGDFDGDGRVDVVMASRGYMGMGTSVVLRNGGELRFTRDWVPSDGENIYRTWAVDIEGDGQEELLFSGYEVYESENMRRLTLRRVPRAP